MEVCVDCVSSARNAVTGGAIRLELCANLAEGGTTPTCGMLRVIKQTVAIPVFVMIRPRGGDFLYNVDEIRVMKEDINSLKEAGADGFVLGILRQDGTVDTALCAELIQLCRPKPVTFHRAIDLTRDISEAMESVIGLECERILTSGGEGNVTTGMATIRRLVTEANDRVIIMPGVGITPANLRGILEVTGAKEFHGTASCNVQSGMQFRKAVNMGAVGDGYTRRETSEEIVRGLVEIYREYRLSCMA